MNTEQKIVFVICLMTVLVVSVNLYFYVNKPTVEHTYGTGEDAQAFLLTKWETCIPIEQTVKETKTQWQYLNHIWNFENQVICNGQ